MRKLGHHLYGKPCYVGIAKDFKKRKSVHLQTVVNGGHKSYVFHAAMRKHGVDCFEFEVVETVVDWAAAVEREATLIRQLGTDTDSGGGYNMTFGGEGFGVLTEQAKRSISESQRARYADPAEREKTRKAIYASPRFYEGVKGASQRAKIAQNKPETRAAFDARNATPETKARRSAAMKELNARPEVKAKISAFQRAFGNTPDERARRSERSKASRTPEVRAAISVGMRLVHTPEYKARKSIAMTEVANRPDVSLKKRIGYTKTIIERHRLRGRLDLIERLTLKLNRLESKARLLRIYPGSSSMREI